VKEKSSMSFINPTAVGTVAAIKILTNAMQSDLMEDVAELLTCAPVKQATYYS
jgi:hypothetical protein